MMEDNWKPIGEVATDAYRKLEAEHLEWLTDEEKADWFGQAKGYATEKGWDPGCVAHLYRERFTGWPRGNILKAEERPCGDEVRMWIATRMREFYRRAKATQKAKDSS